MKFCLNCGHKLKEGQANCPECGTDNSSIQKTGRYVPEKKPETEQRFKRSNRNKILSIIAILAGIIVVIGGLTGVYFSEKKKSDPTLVVNNFESAIKDNNTSEIIKILNHNKSGLKADQNEVQQYLHYLNKNQDLLASNLKVLKTKTKDFGGDSASDEHGNLANQLFDIRSAGKKWGLFQQYQIEIKPFYVEVNSNFTDTIISLDGKKKGETKDDSPVKIGPVLPGDHKVAAEYVGKYSTFKKEKKIDFSKAEKNLVRVGIPLNGSFVNIFTDPSASIFINGEKSDIDPSHANDIGPFATDGSVEIYAELGTEGEPLKSDVVKLTSSDDVHLNFDYASATLLKKTNTDETATDSSTDSTTTDGSATTDVDQNKLSQFIYDFTSHYVQAINNYDFSIVSPYIDPNGQGYKDTSDYVEYMHKKGFTETMENTTLDSVKVLSDTQLEISTTEEYNITYADGTQKYKKFNSHYLITRINGDFLANKLISTEEI